MRGSELCLTVASPPKPRYSMPQTSGCCAQANLVCRHVKFAGVHQTPPYQKCDYMCVCVCVCVCIHIIITAVSSIFLHNTYKQIRFRKYLLIYLVCSLYKVGRVYFC
jgi:hypothetical protein